MKLSAINLYKALPNNIGLKDTFRQHKGLSERYRRKLMNPEDIMTIYDGAVRYHLAASRGYERDLIRHIYMLDSEMINRKQIKPLI